MFQQLHEKLQLPRLSGLTPNETENVLDKSRERIYKSDKFKITLMEVLSTDFYWEFY